MNPIDAVIAVFKDLLGVAPDLYPQVEPVIRRWAKIANVNADEIIREVRPDRFKEIAAASDKRINEMDLPER